MVRGQAPLRQAWRARSFAGCVLGFALAIVPLRTFAAPPLVDWGRAVVDSTMRRLPTPAALGVWEYKRGFLLRGVYQTFLRTGDERYLGYIRSYVDAHVDDDGAIDTTVTTLDNILPGTLLLPMYQLTGEARYKIAADFLRRRFDVGQQPRTITGGLTHNSSQRQLWGDGTYMALPFLAEYAASVEGAAADDAEAANQLLIYARHLELADTGLMRHAYDERRAAPWADPTTGLSPEVWCRALGWYGMALTAVLERLSSDHPSRPALLAILRRSIAAYAANQDQKTGRWYQVVDKGSVSGNWTETSCSSMLTYVVSRAVARGDVSARYLDVAVKGYQGVMQQVSRGTDGLTNLVNTSTGTSVGTLPYYLARKRATNDLHGLGAFLLMYEQLSCLPAGAVTIWLEAEQGTVTTPWLIKSDPLASGDGYIEVAAGASSGSAAPANGHVRYDFNVPKTATYKLWSRAIARTAGDDLLWLRFDNGTWRRWKQMTTRTAWNWDDAHSTTSTTLPLLIKLGAGTHKLELAYSEDGLRLDRLLITNALDYVPSGPGGPLP